MRLNHERLWRSISAMRTYAVVASALLLSGCEKPKDWFPSVSPEVLAHWPDRVKERFPELQTVFGPSCLWDQNISVPPSECFKMTEPRRWRGLWRNDFEGSKFCPAPSRECSNEAAGNDIWLTFPDEMPQTELEPRGELYAIEFVGRRTMHRGLFGHLGMSDHQMIVDRVISMREIQNKERVTAFPGG